MSRLSMSTPCPTYNNTRIPSNRDDLEDTTTTLNFTSAFGPASWRAPPKRKQRHSVQFAIHEDELSAGLQPTRTTLSQTAKRNAVRQPHEDTQSIEVPEHGLQVSVHHRRSSLASSSRLSQAPRRPAARLSIVPETVLDEHAASQKEEPATIGRPARRRTIYIPNEDTTMPSMYMGIFSPINAQPVASLDGAQPTVDVTSIAARMANKRGSRKSIIGAAPRRGPLRSSMGPLQESTIVIDRVGQGGGKENFPPAYGEMLKKTEVIESKPNFFSSRRTAAPQRDQQMGNLHTTRLLPDAVAPSFTKASVRTASGLKPVNTSSQSHRSAWNSGPRPKSIQALPPKIKQAHLAHSTPVVEDVVSKTRAPTRLLVPAVKMWSVPSSHPLLSDDIGASSLYNDDWLEHQETAITQLINTIFNHARPDTIEYSRTKTLTQQLLPLYNVDEMKFMYNRVQAAILYGTLSIPQDVLQSAEGLVKDIGRKQHFIDLWLHSYHHEALVAALEVVTGRVCRSATQRHSGEKKMLGAVSKKTLQMFLETFLLRNEDGRPDKETESRATWSYRRTLLRSLMLIKVLDMAKSDRLVHFASCLFLPGAPHKSSVEVLQALIQMLNPAIGDPVRALGHVNYTITHVQFPLEEFTYNVANLAVDLRDGVRLTRLVELLLYPSASANLSKTFDADATTTILLPAGESFDFSDGQDWPLSQHLKLPCLSRAAKAWNVQVALSAIQNVKGMSSLIDGINAEDIVDGFREKTIRLLWALVGKCGLTSLIDWKDVAWECRRLESQIANDFEIELDEVEDDLDAFDGAMSFESCKSALRNWVRLVAASRNVTVNNFTTSFSDGKVFQAIVDCYEPLLGPLSTEPGVPNISNTSTARPLSDRLINLGCSKQFAMIFSISHGKTHVFDRDFVLAALAFLCSRLLAPSRGIRAAIVIQNAWRQYWARIENTRKEQKRRVASACAQLVQAKTNTDPNLAADLNNKGDVRGRGSQDGNQLGSGLGIGLNHENEKRRTQTNTAEMVSPLKEGDDDFWLSL